MNHSATKEYILEREFILAKKIWDCSLIYINVSLPDDIFPSTGVMVGRVLQSLKKGSLSAVGIA
jgi:hypothetical protein